ncbi:hypothetical protein [Cupriavidus sp. PET2-C1]
MSEYRLKAMRVWVPAALFVKSRGVVAPSGAPFLPTFLARQKSRSPPRRGGETAVEFEFEVEVEFAVKPLNLNLILQLPQPRAATAKSHQYPLNLKP